MGLSFANNNAMQPKHTGPLRVGYVDITFDSSYPTGGEAIAASDLGISTLAMLLCDNDAGYILHFDRANGKIMAYYADYDAGADGALIEVANTTDLSGITTRALYVGY